MTNITYNELEGPMNLVEIRNGNEVIGLMCLRDRDIEQYIKESKMMGDYGEYGEHFAEICAHNFAYTVARLAYVHHYNSTGYLIHGGEYSNEQFYAVQEAAYNYVLPIFRQKLNKVTA